MTLRESRVEFTSKIPRLIDKAFELGFEVAIDEATVHLTQKNPTGNHRPGSNHYEGLAVDLILYKDGFYVESTEAYTELGEYWETLGQRSETPLRWGGRFNDGNHFSYEWKGRK